jgi:hypothetical protein
VTTSLFLLAVLLRTLQDPAPGTGPPEVPFEVTVGQHHRLVLRVPEPWRPSASRPAEGLVEIRITPSAPQDFTLLLTALEPETDSAGRLDEDGIKRLVTRLGTAMLEGAVETELRLLRVEGGAGVGYFYLLTDKQEALPQGEYRHICQGIMAVGPLRLSVTLLTHEPSEELLRAFFRLLEGARVR